MTKKIILYVEDNPANLDLICSFLGAYKNISMISAMSAEDGLSILDEVLPDLILLDINLPGISGIELLKQLKTNVKTKHIPVLAMTASVMLQDIEDGFSSGFDDYLTKPVDLEILSATILDHLGIDEFIR
ncbi:MAG: response regulator [Gammaproteobacteria bacterium]|nr:response regulator [Gammaproteobacteria bacterium]